MTENIRLQNLRDFTVQIRDPETNEIKGTGIVISPDHVITCAHVVEAVLGVEAKDAADGKIQVYFPQISSTEIKTRYATVAGCPIQRDDDIVTLRLIDGSAPLGPEQIAELGSAEHSEGHAFLSYGYSPTLEYPGTRADGYILGSVEPPAGKILHADPIQISSQQIDYGMSGAAVLDTKLNLVVGLVAARYFPKTWTKGDIAYAVDAKVLTFDPFHFKLREEALPLRPGPSIRIDVSKATTPILKKTYPAWNNAFPSIAEWVGRADLLKSITNDWINSDKRVTGLIGVGGVGKSSLARRWIDEILQDATLPQPDGIFWWGFYDRPSVDEFIEAALNYLSDGNTELARLYPSSSARVHLLAGMLHGGRYLFVLDGLEVLQHQEGDQFGLLKNDDLREFLMYFAAPNHPSFCLVTSRAPLFDLMDYTTYRHHDTTEQPDRATSVSQRLMDNTIYQHRDVECLSASDGRALLQKLGVKGTDSVLDKVVSEWDGHALTLRLIGSCIANLYDGDIEHIKDITAPTAGEPRHKRVHSILRHYDEEHLSEEERAFLKIFSAFRIPVDKIAFENVFRAKSQEGSGKSEAINAPIAVMDDAAFDVMVKRLVDYRILRYDLCTHEYNTHPLIRSHYYDLLMAGDRSQAISVHRLIKEYYLAKSEGNIPDEPKLDDLEPLIEAVHHACQSEDYDEASQILIDHILQSNSRMLQYKLGAWETVLAIMLEFLPNGDISKDPLVSDLNRKEWILNELGLALMNLSRLRDSMRVYERSLTMALERGELYNVSIVYQNIAELYSQQGSFRDSINASNLALEMSIKARDKQEEEDSLASLAWTSYLIGDIKVSDENFRKAEALMQEIRPNKVYLYSTPGIHHADFLRRIGAKAHARKIIEASLDLSIRKHLPSDISRCHRALGDLDVDNIIGCNDAQKHYNEAEKFARNISDHPMLMEALLSRGKMSARYMKDSKGSLADLSEALDYAVRGGYRVYEADIRVALAWAHLAAGNKEKAEAEAIHAKQMSKEMGYYWGNIDADEVLTEIEKA
jgi:tetratricopeptide (TPR) repeat protein